VSRGGPRGALRLAVALGAGLAALPGCGPPAPEPHTRIAGWTPSGPGADREPLVTVDFTAPIAADGLAEGLLVALARAADARTVARALEAGQPPGPPALAADQALAGEGRRIELRPLARLSGGTAYAVVVAPTLRDAEGRPVLDPEGHRRTFVGTFTTVAGPPPRPVLTEARAVAETPQAGGEYVELLNLGEEPLDLSGWRLEKRTASGSLAGCTVAFAAEALAPGAFGLLTSEAWDGRYPVPAGTVRFTCGSSTLAGGLSDERPPEVRLLDPAGALLATLGEGDAAPSCPAAVERIDPLGPDQAPNLACAEDGGTPGWCNSVTPPAWCPEGWGQALSRRSRRPTSPGPRP
jgi:hypothetical protein